MTTRTIGTKFDAICETVSSIEFSEATAEKLIGQMVAYRATYSRTYCDLMKVPGFRKLWQAIEEAADASRLEGAIK